MVTAILNDLISTTTNAKSISVEQPNIYNNGYVKSAGKKDVARLSNLSQKLYKSGINVHNSQMIVEKGGFKFSLDYLSPDESKLTANGIYSKEKNSLAVNLDYRFPLEENEEKSKYELNFNFKFNNLDELNVEKEANSYLVHSFVGKVVDDIVKKFGKGNISILGLMMHKEEIQNLLGIDGKSGKELLGSLLGVIVMTADLKGLTSSKDENSGKEVFNTEKAKEIEALTERDRSESLDYFLEVRKISSKISKKEASKEELS